MLEWQLIHIVQCTYIIQGAPTNVPHRFPAKICSGGPIYFFTGVSELEFRGRFILALERYPFRIMSAPKTLKNAFKILKGYYSSAWMKRPQNLDFDH